MYCANAHQLKVLCSGEERESVSVHHVSKKRINGRRSYKQKQQEAKKRIMFKGEDGCRTVLGGREGDEVDVKGLEDVTGDVGGQGEVACRGRGLDVQVVGVLIMAHHPPLGELLVGLRGVLLAVSIAGLYTTTASGNNR